MLQEIEQSVILKQEYDSLSGKYYILVRTDKASIAFYGSYGNRTSMRVKVFPKEQYYSKKSEKEKTYKEDRNRSFDTFIPSKNKKTFIETIKDNSDVSTILNKQEQEKIKAEQEKRRKELEQLKKDNEKKQELLKQKKHNMDKIKGFDFSIF